MPARPARQVPATTLIACSLLVPAPKAKNIMKTLPKRRPPMKKSAMSRTLRYAMMPREVTNAR